MQAGLDPGLTLPAPDDDSAAHSAQVAAHIAARMAAQDGSISFADFMQQALYAPGLGYYVAGSAKFGPAGDFVTAPEISPLFGRVVARQCADVLAQLGGGQILELGAGSGALAVAVLERLATLDAQVDRYCILEVSPDLQQRQEEILQERLPAMAGCVEWLAEVPAGFTGVVLANEVADALPVERFQRTADGVSQYRVRYDEGAFHWCTGDAPPALAAAVGEVETRIGRRLPDAYRSEICLALQPWVGDVVAALRHGMVLLFDYGVTGREYYAADRQEGWLRCHFRHHAHEDPLILPGIQDLSAWVDFSALADAAVGDGAEIAGFVTQAHFLLNGGLEEELAGFDALPEDERLELSRQTKLLTLPAEMGEHFKCLGLARGELAPPPAFCTADRTHLL